MPRIFLGLGFLFALALPPAHAHDAADVATDPPGRVARLNHHDGSVAFSEAGSEGWSRVHVNRPLVAGDRVWVEQGARSELHIGSTAVRLGGQTSLTFLELDDDAAQLKLAQGTLTLHVRALEHGESYEVATPNLAFAIREPGRYRIDVAPDGAMTTVTVRHGSGIAYGDASSTIIDERQQVRFTGTGLDIAGATSDPPLDAFDRWTASRDRAEETSTAARYVSREVIGYEQLDAYGSWRHTREYGMVWVPHRVAAGWAPYRSGHWTWIEPWGWTWVDDAPWGFAPYHYGRWAYAGRGWCWVPGPLLARARPVYAPALVVFVGGADIRLSVTAGPGIGWIPLAPGETYRPPYRASPDHVRHLNRTVAGRQSAEPAHAGGYRNRHAPHAITAVPVSVFSRGRPVMPAAKTVQPKQLGDGVPTGTLHGIHPDRRAIAGSTRWSAPPAARRSFERQVVTPARQDGTPARQVGTPVRREGSRVSTSRETGVEQGPGYLSVRPRNRDDARDWRNERQVPAPAAIQHGARQGTPPSAERRAAEREVPEQPRSLPRGQQDRKPDSGPAWKNRDARDRESQDPRQAPR